MTVSNHTPGPWKKTKIAVVIAVESDHDFRGVADCRTVDVTNEEANANARLIAAAPDLLAACQMVLQVLAHERIKDPSDPNYVNAAVVVANHAIAEKMVREAVAKATGATGKLPGVDPTF